MTGGRNKFESSADFSWESALKLPEAAYAGNRRIPKAMLVRQALLTKTEQKTLDKVKLLTHFATVQKSTARILPLVDEGHDIQSVLFLRCELDASEAYADIARLIHKCFPNPTVILFGGFEGACISVAVTRKSHAEQGAIVIERTESTGRFFPGDEAYGPFWDAIAFARLPQDNLLNYVEEIAWNIQLSRALGTLGFYPTCVEVDRPKLMSLVKKNNEKQKQIEDAFWRRRWEKDLTLNETAKLRIQEKKLKQEQDLIAKQIKEICHE